MKKRKKDRWEKARREAEKDPVVRELRRRAAAIRAELEARDQGDAASSS